MYMYVPTGHRLKILWGRSQASEPGAGDPGGAKLSSVPGLPERMYCIYIMFGVPCTCTCSWV